MKIAPHPFAWDGGRLRRRAARQVRPAAAQSRHVRYDPYHPEGTVAEYCRIGDWRKLAPGMILNLLRCWPIDAGASFLVGDKDNDLAVAVAAGITGHLFASGDLAASTLCCDSNVHRFQVPLGRASRYDWRGRRGLRGGAPRRGRFL
jgi:HAD-hyrolase-like